MGIPEGNTLVYQVIGQISGRGEALQRSGSHAVTMHGDRGHHIGKYAQRTLQGINGIEQRFLVFLVVLVIGEWLTLHQHQQADQVAGHAAALATHQLRNVRVFLLWHDAGAGTEAVRQFNKIKLCR